MLPVENAEKFALDLKETGIENFIIQPFHSTKGRFVAGTRKEAMEIVEKYKWDDAAYQKVFKIIQTHIPNIGVGKEGFAPK